MLQIWMSGSRPAHAGVLISRCAVVGQRVLPQSLGRARAHGSTGSRRRGFQETCLWVAASVPLIRGCRWRSSRGLAGRQYQSLASVLLTRRKACSAVADRSVAAPAGGGLSVLSPDPGRYEELLDAKVQGVHQLLGSRLNGTDMRVVPSPPLHHRMKVTLSIRHFDNGDLAFTMDEPGSRRWVAVEEFPILCERLERLMVNLREALLDVPDARYKAFQVEMLANTDGDALACLMYHRPLNDEYLDTAAALAELTDASIVGRSRGRRVVAGKGRLVQWHEVGGKRYPQIHQELMFSQSNAHICREMLQWVVEQTKPCGRPTSDLLELHCGNGNFTLPLSANFQRVLATETVRGPTLLAEECASWIDVDNIDFVRLSAEETALAVRRERSFRRLADAGVRLDELDLATVLVDPPRAGLDLAARDFVHNFDRVLYVSCNPQRLAVDLEAFPEHKVSAAAFFDQFPFTDHCEVALLLEKQ